MYILSVGIVWIAYSADKPPTYVNVFKKPPNLQNSFLVGSQNHGNEIRTNYSKLKKWLQLSTSCRSARSLYFFPNIGDIFH